MPTWTQPTVADTYVNWDAYLQARADSQAKMFDDGLTWTSLPTGTIRWSTSGVRFEKWNGSAWANLSTALTDVCKTANNLSDLASASTARTNLGLGTMAVVNSPVPVANGGTAATDAATARTNLGLGTMATQAASAVAITGGSLAGITSMSINNSVALGWPSTDGGQINNVTIIQNGSHINYKAQASGGTHIWHINSVSELTLSASALYPSSNLGLDLGGSGNYFSSIYANQILLNYIGNSSGDIAVRFGGTSKWVFGSTSFEFKPSNNGTQDIGGSSALVNNVYCNRILAASGLDVQFNAGTIEYLATSSNSHRFYNSGGAVELWKIDGSNGKLVPVYITRGDFTVNGVATGGNGRTLDHGSQSLAKLYETVGWLIGDLTNLGFLT